MPVYRYRSFEEAQQALWRFETGVGYYRMLAELFHLGRQLSPPAHRTGIFRFRSLEEANVQRRLWDREAIRERLTNN